ncbi:tRNA preQ1(34) S-adenosylmethionine ribosyltransferase-isomerase QueA [Methylocystis heyeri]|uniref:S-adenosylmethionine:tRNA ribosyltransferase-isomerase n=1 Tax=Methylocystis heyeri TaxID=391905 RepID=A0A6B8K911_9HYPH|nr:tRNA preQ1(34) S-adenosylmethionine ribosyltransferase-isomerase QueA [Methylocystis heyeri]QGM44556.1 tRNA preQ1(34) S-adenosylmethionine ribosyltransferase-isomerase QueA [Methylocystis heyeri]
MRVDLFDFELPQERIALRPSAPRDSSRMLVVPPGAAPFEDRIVRDLPSFLRPGDALVINDTRVVRARLSGFRLRGENKARVEVTLIERLGGNCWRAMAKPAKKLGLGEQVCFVKDQAKGVNPPLEGEGRREAAGWAGALKAIVEERGDNGEVTLRFDLSGELLDQAIEDLGAMPLPPYIAGKRAVDASDDSDYQTLFAREAGAVAAPTAGLHFTPELLSAIEAAGARIHNVTLHVGAGTFLPVKAEDTADHQMHYEHAVLSAETAAALNEIRTRGGRIFAVGTTALRCLESAADENGELKAYSARTNIFITPGYKFRAVDVLLTNFHLPRSTLFMLVCAFCGVDRMKAAYAHAIAQGYRFYSYGDASLLYRA